MQKTTLTFIMMWLFVLFGCVPSLHELYTDRTLVFDPAIEGRWQQQDDEAVWEFAADPQNKSYALTIYEEKNRQSILTAHLVDIDGQRFFDFYPAEDAEIGAGNWLKAHLVAAHLFLKVEQDQDKLTLAMMHPDIVGKLLEEKPELVKHERIDGRIVLTDAPKGLQAFVTTGLQIEDFFGDPVTLKRIPY